MINHSKMKLGKNAPRHDVRTLQMAQYLQPEALPKIPPSQEWYDKVSQWPMMMNNRSARNSCSFSARCRRIAKFIPHPVLCIPS